MKELLRITYSLMRPSRVGIFNKDKIFIPFLHAIVMFVLYIGILAISIFNTLYLGKGTAEDATELLQIHEFAGVTVDLGEDEILYDSTSNEFINVKGNTRDWKMGDYGLYVYFFMEDTDKAYKIPNNVIVLDFKESYVNVYYNSMFSKGAVKHNYSDSVTSDFDLYDALKGELEPTIVLTQIITDAFEKANVRYQAYTYAQEVLRALLFYAVIILFLLLVSTVTNPMIDRKVRLKLVLYDSMTYPFIMMLMYMFNFTYLQYAALVIPFIYTIITFRHILRLKK